MQLRDLVLVEKAAYDGVDVFADIDDVLGIHLVSC